MTKPVNNWGRQFKSNEFYKTVRAHEVLKPQEVLKTLDKKTCLAHGMGRSYGDSCLNSEGLLLQMTERDQIIHFDVETGVIKAQAGVTFDTLLKIIVPRGWFLPVTPGSKFITLGGAVANDVHGKNHHAVGSFGNFIRAFYLVSSSGKGRLCSPEKNKNLFRYTIGGLGLTGVIDWVEFQLIPIKSAFLDVENIRYNSLDEFFALSEKSREWSYSVAWIDCFAPQHKSGRGVFTRARFSDYGGLTPHKNDVKLKWRFAAPSFILNRFSIGLFNKLYRWRPGAGYFGRQHYDNFFYPLDGVIDWNKIYGRKGLFQHQCLIPEKHAEAGIREMLSLIKKSGQGSFLAVLKLHGADMTPGMMSFCKAGAGVSLALDFANRGQKTRDLLEALDQCVIKHFGRNYIAKDGHMSSETLQKTYPIWKKLEQMRDPLISSSFWRRITPTVGKDEGGV